MPSFPVSPGSSPQRIDSFLARTLPHGSRRTVREMITAGAVRINGRRVRKGSMVAGGDTVEVADACLVPRCLQPNPQVVLPILYEDAAVLALDKPAGMPSHALREDEAETVANFLLARYPEVATVGTGALEPGIVHRLDTETSGVLLVARTPAAHAGLRRQFKEQRVRKEYRAVVHGDVTRPGELRTPIAHTRGHTRMRVCPPGEAGGRPALTRYQPLERAGAFTVLAVEIVTGVMHQIRVHLASIGHPVVGDRIYGPTGIPADTVRHLLHAYRLGFAHPESAQDIDISSPLPQDFAAFLDGMREKRRRLAAGRA